MGQLVDEGMEHEGQGIGARGPERSGRNAERHQRLLEPEIWDEAGRELGRGESGAAGRLVSLTEGDEVIFPGDQLAGGIDATLEEMEPGGTIEVVFHVVLAGPQELDRRPDLLGDPGRLDHVIVGQPASESAAAPNHVDGDVGGSDA